MNKYDMLIFDIDGTLWEASELTADAMNMIADEYPEIDKVTLETVNSVMGLSVEDIAKKIMPNMEFNKAIYYVNLQMKKAFELINKNGAHIYEGVSDTIKKLSEMYKLGIITNNSDNYVELFLTKSNLKDYFVDYIGTTSYNITKAEAMNQMIKRNNVSNACYIGDIKKDMMAAQQAKVPFIHARYGFEPNVKSDLYINNIKELVEIK